MSELTTFIKQELKPRFYANIQQILPELHFTKKRDRYVSSLHADGTEGTGKKEDRSVVTEKKPTKVFDNTRQEATDIIDLYMQFNHITEVWEAVKNLCNIVGINPPESTPEQKEIYRKKEERRKVLENSLIRQKAALFAPDGKEVLDYLHARGWTDSEIQEAELGFISSEEANCINAQRTIGDFYTLSIPLRDGGDLYGFKFRTLQKNIGDKDKYSYLYGTEKKTNLFNLTGAQQEKGSIIVVEGELDALHAQVRGITGFVATGGGGITDEQLSEAIGRGIKRIILFFDKDERGEAFTKKSIEKAAQYGVSVLVATLPDGETLPNGKAVHDIDEYLQIHTPQELKNLIENAEAGFKSLLWQIIQEAQRTCENGVLTDAQEVELRDNVIELANKAPNEVERELVFNLYADYMEIDGKRAFSPEALRAVADRKRAEKDTLRRKEETGKALNLASEEYKKGDIEAALQTIEATVKRLKQIGEREKYGDLLRIPNRAERIAKFKEQPDALKTSYQFTEGGAPLPLELPYGALTIIAAPTSHGKSSFMRNLAIDVAKRYKDGEKSTLYFTFEESEEDVLAQFVNTYIGKQLHEPSRTYSQTESIIHYYKTGEPTYIKETLRAEFIKKEQEFFTDFIDSGKIRIFYRDYNLESLLEALEFAVSNIPTKAIFIDYIQILRSQKFARQPRAEQLKEICISLKDFSVKHKIPVILAAQLNREATTPLRMSNTQMAESSDIEKAANTIICLWNSNFKYRLYGGKEPGTDEKNELKTLEDKKFKLGEDGKLFALVTKMRGSRGVGMYSIFEYNGYSGEVKGNYTPKDATQQELPFDEPNEDENPF